jgi:putative tryptophan/tyrosine transport system substrate-binding protein
MTKIFLTAIRWLRSDNRKAAPRTKIPNRKWVGLFAIVVALTVCRARAEAQQAKIPRIGYLSANSASAEQPRLDTFRQGLHALGYIEGQNTVIEYRFTDGKFDRLAELAAELVNRKVDVLIAVTTNAAVAAKRVTSKIPIFFIGVSDPIAAGLIDSLPRPGGNITGLTNIAPALAGKRLELLKETVPKLSRVAVLWDPQNAGSIPQWQESQLAARELGLQLYSMEVSSTDKYDNAFKQATKAGSTALAATLNPLANSNQKLVVELATKSRLPAIYASVNYVENGGMMSYAQNIAADGRDASRLVDKLLRGAKPADIPVEQPTRFEFVINLQTAKQIGLKIPPDVLARADKVIKEASAKAGER